MAKPNKDRKANERRRDRRVVVTAVAEIEAIPPGNTAQGYITNLSRGGLGLFSQSSFLDGTDVLIRLTFFGSQGITESNPIRGIVTRCQPVGSVFSIGIQFVDLKKEANRNLLEQLDLAERSLYG